MLDPRYGVFALVAFHAAARASAHDGQAYRSPPSHDLSCEQSAPQYRQCGPVGAVDSVPPIRSSGASGGVTPDPPGGGRSGFALSLTG
jgi:hypothetical protein